MTGKVSKDTAEVAAGTGLVFTGGIIDRGVRLLTTWVLTRGLGPAGFGIYTLAMTIATIVRMVAPLGTDVGTIMFGAQRRSEGQLKGVVQVALLFSVLGGMVMGGGLAFIAAAGVFGDTLVVALPIAALGVVVGAPMVVMGAILQATRQMRAYSWVMLVGQSLAGLVGVSVALFMGWGVLGALAAVVAAQLFTLLMAGRVVARGLGRMLLDRSIVARRDISGMLSFSLPQSLGSVLWRLQLWTDVLMLGWLASAAEVGIYRLGLSIAMLGTLPLMAVTTAFNPMAARLVAERQLPRLDGVLKVTTRLLVVGMTPFYLVLALVPEQVLGLFDVAFVEGAAAMCIVLLGQAIYVITGPTAAVLMMAGFSRVDLANNLGVVGLNVGLNAWLIPTMGIEGAAIASVVALSVWSLARVIEVGVLLGCWAFDRRTTMVMALGGMAIPLALWLPHTPWLRLVAAGIAVLGFVAVVFLVPHTDEERGTWEQISRRFVRT